MKPAKFTLEKIYYPTLSVRANPEYDWQLEDAEVTEPQVRVAMTPSDEPNSFNMSVTVSIGINCPSDRYDIEVLAVGHFDCNEGDNQDAIRTIAISGPNILYGAIRDQVMSLTNRSAWGEYILPAATFEPSDFDLINPDSADDD